MANRRKGSTKVVFIGQPDQSVAGVPASDHVTTAAIARELVSGGLYRLAQPAPRKTPTAEQEEASK